MYILQIIFFRFLIHDPNNSSPRAGPQDLLVTHYDCEENEQNTLHKYAKTKSLNVNPNHNQSKQQI